MQTTLLSKRKFEGETYKVFLNAPEYEGETGVCGIVILPYITVQTPENAFGYSDTVMFDRNGRGYTLHRYLAPYIIRQLEKVHEFWKRRLSL